MYNWNYFNIIQFKNLSVVVSSERIQLVNIKYRGGNIRHNSVAKQEICVGEKEYFCFTS